MHLELKAPITLTYARGDMRHEMTGEYGGIWLYPDGQARLRVEWEQDDETSQDIPLDRVLNIRRA
jgi:hypothetical protein